MQHCGALRFDHIMSLSRLWWCLLNEQYQQQGCYMHYPLEQLMAILTLESQLNQCVIIGEDLGNVTAQLSAAMHQARIYSSKLLYFCRDQQGRFLDTDQLEKHSCMMIANHDVATFKAWWQVDDLQLNEDLALTKSVTLLSAQADSHQEKKQLLSWLQRHQQPRQMHSPYFSVYSAIVTVLAHCEVQLLTIALDDLDDNNLPVNIPGTDQQYPNWRRRYNKSLSEIFNDNNFFTTINDARS